MTASTPLRIVLYEGLGSRPLADRFEVTRALLEQGYAVTGARGKGREASGPPAGTLLVLGRFTEEKPREAEAPEAGCTVLFRDVDGLDRDAIVQVVEAARAETAAARPGGWKPWFPVIDYSRCTNCMQCLTFCLFDVYGVSKEHKIEVKNAVKCKTDCPACSRVCPEVAILFPKYKAGPINGDEISQADVEREKLKVDISALLGGDIYAALRQRSEHARTRFGKERDDKRALDERKRCLAKLQQDLDIPPEVLASLPSADEIRARTERAVAETQGS